MSNSAGEPGPPSNSTSQGENSPPAPPNDSSTASETVNAPPPSNNNNNNNNNNNDDDNNNNNSNNNNDNNNNNNNNSTSSSPPPNSNSPTPSSPPPSNSGSNGSPPSESPPPISSPPPSSPLPSSPPPSSQPPTPSSSSSSPPPQSSPPPPSSEKSPPSSSGQSSPPPSSGQSSPPPPEKSNSPSHPAPSNGTADSGGSKWSPPQHPTSPPPPSSSTHVGVSPPPVNSSSAVHSPPTTPGSPSSKASPPGSSSTPTSSGTKTNTTSTTPSSTTASSTVNHGTIVGATVAGVFVVALIALFFVVRQKRRRRDTYATHYMPPPSNFPEKSDGYYYSQPYVMGHSGAMDTYYVTQTQQSPMGNSYGSQRGNNYHGGGSDSGVIGGSKTFFTYEEVMEITNGFARESVIGEGGFGCVYKGKLSDGKEVAVKTLKAGSGQGEREFRAEVEIISRVHHRHLVSLVGYCIAESNRLLIYEFVPNNNLDHHLHGRGMPVLDWNKRVKIAIGAAKGLAYLHEDCHPKIIHRDIKSANILLDDDFEAQVADFGLAKLNDTTQTHVSTRVMGTFGYLAPEYASSGKLTDRSDVFSFGVVLLELITGRKPVDPTQPLGDESLVEWARPLLVRALETGDISELVDPRLEKHYVESEVFRMIESAAACVRHSGPKRPRMVQVVRALDSEGEMSDLSNGVKYGQSTVYDSGQYNQDIMMFRKMALGGGDSSEFSGEYTTREISPGHTNSAKSGNNSSDFTSGESETRAMNQHTGEQKYSGPQTRYGRRF